MASVLNEESVEKKLRTVTNSQDSIQTLSLWIIHHKANHAKIVELWMRVLKKSGGSNVGLPSFLACLISCLSQFLLAFFHFFLLACLPTYQCIFCLLSLHYFLSVIILPGYLPFFLSSSLPACLPSFLPSCLLYFLLFFQLFLDFLSASLLALLPAYFLNCSILVYLPSFLPIYLPS